MYSDFGHIPALTTDLAVPGRVKSIYNAGHIWSTLALTTDLAFPGRVKSINNAGNSWSTLAPLVLIGFSFLQITRTANSKFGQN